MAADATLGARSLSECHNCNSLWRVEGDDTATPGGVLLSQEGPQGRRMRRRMIEGICTPTEGADTDHAQTQQRPVLLARHSTLERLA